MAIQSVKVNHNGKNYKVYKGQQGGMYIVRKNKKVYLQSGSGRFADLRAAAAKKFAAAKDMVKSAATTVGNVASGVASGVASVAKGTVNVIGTAAQSLNPLAMIGGSMYLQMSEQFGGQGISVRINGKYRKVFATKSGKFYYKQNNKKVSIKQDGGVGFFGALAAKALPFAKSLGTQVFQQALAAPAPVAAPVAAPVVYATPVAPPVLVQQPAQVPVLVQGGGVRTVGPAYVLMQTGGSGLKVRNGRKNVRVFMTKGGRFYYKQNGKKITIQRGSSMFSKMKAAAAKAAAMASKAAAASPALVAAAKAAVEQQVMKTVAANPALAQQASQVASQVAAVPQLLVQQPPVLVQQPAQVPVLVQQPAQVPVLVQGGGSCGRKNCPCGNNCKCGKNCKC